MAKKLLALFISLFIFASTATAVSAEPVIDVITNGGTGTFNAGGVVVISGKLTDAGIPLPNSNVMIRVSEASGKSIFYTATKSNSEGYYRTIFTLPDDLASGQSTVNVTAGQAKATTIFTTPGGANTLAFLGTYPKGSTGDPMDVVPIDTTNFALVFNANVNYFINKNYPDFTIGRNENNVDSISLYKGDSSTPVRASVSLIQSDSQNKTDFAYYDTASQSKVTETKRVIVITPDDGLSPNTIYRVKVSGELCANNGGNLGEDVTVSFKTGAAPAAPPVTTVPPVPVGGGTLPPAVPAEKLGSITVEKDKTTLEIDPAKASDLIKDSGNRTLVIDVSQISVGAGKEKAVKLPAEVVNLVISENKTIAIKDGGLIIIVPPGALLHGKEMILSSSQVSGQSAAREPVEAEQKVVYTFNAFANGDPVHSFQKEITLSLPIPEGIADQEKLGVYFLNETKTQWEYIGGRVVDGKLVFRTNHFSTFMVAESRKTFGDLASHWARKDIEVMVARHMVNGVDDNAFAPDNNITRAEFAALLSRVLKLGDAAGDSAFQDVAGNEWYAGDVMKAAKAGIIEGADRNFRPGDMISRQEMAVMIQRAYHYAGGKVSALKETAFTDKASISTWAEEAIKSVYALGIVSGRPDGSFGPMDHATRAEGAVMLKALMDKLGL
ncbi:S-layer homology domain-containing protein [Paenibacillus sp. SI8]|uniref:S-layer homology domain-containing protein n=1 Tax=unclassified Paenibacillus TaxID=185978 RepID=UPI0034675626